MSEVWDAIYQATNQKLQNCDVGNAVENAILNLNLSHFISQLVDSIGYEQTRPSTIYRPHLYRDGNQWCAAYHKPEERNLMENIVGFGDSPAEAFSDFDTQWTQRLKDGE